MILILLYGISPVDLIPDVVPLLGWFDDVTLLLVLLWGWERCLPPQCAAIWIRPLVHLFNTALGISLCTPTLEGSGKTVSFEGGHCRMKRGWPSDCRPDGIGVDSTPFTLWVWKKWI